MDSFEPLNKTGKSWLKLAATLALFFPIASQAVLLDWDVQDWTDTTSPYVQSFDIDATFPGNDITITITDPSTRMVAGFPDDDTGLEGGTSGPEQSLRTRADFSTTSQVLEFKLEFLYDFGVQDFTFNIFDVDAGTLGFVGDTTRSWNDEIRNIRGYYYGGAEQYATLTGSPSNAVYNSGTANARVVGLGNAANTGAGSDQGNVTMSFGTTALKEVYWTWGNGTNANTNPSEQHISFHDFSFTKRIPEYHPGLMSAFMCSLLAISGMIRRMIGRPAVA